MPIISQDAPLAGLRTELATKAPLTQTQGAIAYANAITLDLAALNGTAQTITLSGPLTLAATGMAAGRSVVLRLINAGAERTLSLPSEWSFVGAKPTVIDAGFVGRLRLDFWGDSQLDCVADWRSGAIGVSAAFDPDAAAWFASVEAAGSVFAEGAKEAYNDFFISEKANGNLDAFNNGMLLAFTGFTRLAGCFEPMRSRGGAKPTNLGFVSGQKSVDELQGNGLAFINCGIGFLPEQADNHCMFFSGDIGTINFGAIIGPVNSAGTVFFIRNTSPTQVLLASGGGSTVQAPVFAEGTAILNRTSTTDYSYTNNGSTTNYSAAIGTIETGNISIFSGVIGASDCTLRFAGWGGALTDPEGFEVALNTLKAALADLDPPNEQEASIGPTFIFSGESNSGGLGLNSDLSSGELDANPDIRILNNLTLELDPLDIGTNNLLDHEALTNGTTHGWEAGIQTHLSTVTGSPRCYIIKTGQGGSGIAQWTAGSTYSVKQAERINQHKNLVVGSNYRVWLTFGINDAIAGTNPTTWRTDTEAWIARMRTVVGVPTLKFFVTKLMPNTAAKIAINEQWDLIAAEDSNVLLLDTSNETSYPLRDGSHWGAVAMKKIAREFLRLEFGV